MKTRLDIAVAAQGLSKTRSQAESDIKLGKILIDGRVVTKPGFFVSDGSVLTRSAEQSYVSRAGLKLASVAQLFALDFKDTVVLDVGSSTGGFTDFALKNGAKKVIAIDVGTDQLHPSLRSDRRIELHEKTDIRDVWLESSRSTSSGQGVTSQESSTKKPSSKDVILQRAPDVVLIDVSFISLQEIIPHVCKLMTRNSTLVAMAKPQFEASRAQVSKGVIKNDTVRRAILKQFEAWVNTHARIINKADSEVAGAKGNRERFYVLKRNSTTSPGRIM